MFIVHLDKVLNVHLNTPGTRVEFPNLEECIQMRWD